MRSRIFSALLCALLFAWPAAAQEQRGSIEGAVKDTTVMSVLDGKTNINKATQELLQLKETLAIGPIRVVAREMVCLDGIHQAVSSDKAHRVERPALRIGAKPVYRRDPRVVQPAGDLGFEPEALPAHRRVGLSPALPHD